jgi:hypothetical protein
MPVDLDTCLRILQEHDAYIEAQRSALMESAATITADENVKRAIVDNLIERIVHTR